MDEKTYLMTMNGQINTIMMILNWKRSIIGLVMDDLMNRNKQGL